VTVSPWNVRSAGTWRTAGGSVGMSVVTLTHVTGRASSQALPCRFEHVYDVPEFFVDRYGSVQLYGLLIDTAFC
jgi:hypothetical protein